MGDVSRTHPPLPFVPVSATSGGIRDQNWLIVMFAPGSTFHWRITGPLAANVTIRPARARIVTFAADTGTNGGRGLGAADQGRNDLSAHADQRQAATWVRGSTHEKKTRDRRLIRRALECGTRSVA